jgi:hypothetical protein
VQGAAVWAAGNACIVATMGGAALDMASALATARELGATGWPAAELLTSFRAGMVEGLAARQNASNDPGE